MPKFRVAFSLFALPLLAGLLIAQRADRATVTGLVTDPTGQTIPGAAVKIRYHPKYPLDVWRWLDDATDATEDPESKSPDSDAT